ERTRGKRAGVRRRAGYRGRHPARSGKPVREGAMARTAPRRHLHQARELDVLLPARHVAHHLPHPDHRLRVVRTALSCTGRCGLGALMGYFELLLLAVLSFGAVSHADAADEIRVGLVEDGRSVEVGGGPMSISDAAGRLLTVDTPTWIRALPERGGVEVRSHGAPSLRTDRGAVVRLTPVDGGRLKLNGREYPGAIEVTAGGAGLVAINDLSLEGDPVGVVKAEAGDRMPMEMLKAQAIVARTYAAYQRQINAAKPYHIVASTANQQYVGRVAPESPAWTAVRETQGQVLIWNGYLFPAFYHTDSGGYTEDPRAVFAASNMPALKPGRGEFPSASPYQKWQLDMPLAEIGARLLKGGVSVGTIIALD